MVHGPCKALNPTSPCMKDGKNSSKKFPKAFNEHTSYDGNGYPVYKRRDTSAIIDKNCVTIDTRCIMNLKFLLKFE